MPDVEFVPLTPAEMEQGWALQLEEEHQKALAWAEGKGRRPLTEEEAELRADGILDDPDSPIKPSEICETCGRKFKYANLGMAKAQLARHRKRVHPETVEVGG